MWCSSSCSNSDNIACSQPDSGAVGSKGAPLLLAVAIIIHMKENVRSLFLLNLVMFDLQLTNATKGMVILLDGKEICTIKIGEE